MADYISRDEFAEHLADIQYGEAPTGRTGENIDYQNGVYAGFDMAYVALKQFPAADVVEVVRCKDCELWCMTMPEDERKKATENPWTDGVCELYESDGFSPNDFCSNARRREDE